MRRPKRYAGREPLFPFVVRLADMLHVLEGVPLGLDPALLLLPEDGAKLHKAVLQRLEADAKLLQGPKRSRSDRLLWDHHIYR
jgi:hypothetical protein